MLDRNVDYNTYLAVDFRASRTLLREKREAGDPAGKAEEAPGPPVESEDLRGNQQRINKS